MTDAPPAPDIAAAVEKLRQQAEKEPLGVDVSDYGDEWVAGFLRGQVNALEEVGPTIVEALNQPSVDAYWREIGGAAGSESTTITALRKAERALDLAMGLRHDMDNHHARYAVCKNVGCVEERAAIEALRAAAGVSVLSQDAEAEK